MEFSSLKYNEDNNKKGWLNNNQSNENEELHLDSVTYNEPEKLITMQDVKNFVAKYVWVFWLFSVIPLGSIVGDSLGTPVQLILVIIQLTALFCMVFLGGFKNLFR